MGKSSSGKDTVFRELLKKKTLNLEKIVLYTTRPPREDEKNGIDYYFVNQEILEKMEDLRECDRSKGIPDYPRGVEILYSGHRTD